MYVVAAMALFGLGLHAFLFHRHLVRKIIALNVMGSAVFLLLIAMAARSPEPDPVPHAMVLTGIVVAVSLTAFALFLVRRLHKETGEAHLPEAP